MSPIRKLQVRFRALVAREAVDAELDEELQFHLEQQISLFESQGMDRARARTEAMRLFGGVEKFKEECRDQRGVGLIDNLLQDVTFALRSLKKTKGFAVLAIVTLALGIGANTAIFSVVNGVLLAPLPYPDGEDLVLLQARAPSAQTPRQTTFSILEFYEYRDAVESLDLVEYHSMTFTLLGHGYPSTVLTGVVSHDFFDVLGVEPQLGRMFVAADENAEGEAVLVLSDRYWRAEFDADPGIVGQVFEMNDRPHRVIGVLPRLPQHPRYNDVYMPTSACPYRAGWDLGMESPREGFRNLRVFGRLAGDKSMGHAHQEVAAIAGEVRQRDPDVYDGTGYAVDTAPLQDVLTRGARPMLMALIGTVTLVLLVACANVANLMVARVMRRGRELALRAALGAGRGRLLRQLLTESTMLAVAGGALGLVIAALGLDMLVEFMARFTNRTTEIGIDAPVLLFTFAVSVATGIAFGVLPGMWASTDVLESMREGSSSQSTAGRRTLRARGLLIAGQVALSFMLLIGAGLMLTSFVKLSRVDPGFEVDNVLTAQVSPNWTEYQGQAVGPLYTSLLEALRDGPGVMSAAVANTVPFGGVRGPLALLAENRPPGLDGLVEPIVRRTGDSGTEQVWPFRLYPFGISAEYFETVGIPVLEGRALTEAEIDGAGEVAMISASARDRYWPDRSPIGERIAVPNMNAEPMQWATIVGVVGDAKHFALELDAPPALFASYLAFGGAGQLLVRTSADSETMSAFVRETLAEMAPRQPVENFQTMVTLRSAALATPKLTTTLIAMFAGLALLITVAGIGGVVAFSVNQRTQEIGIRMALGAPRQAVLGMVVRQGLGMVLAGLALGAVGALWFSNLVATFLFETEPTDPLTFLGVAIALLVATALACWLPARRATTIDPVVALRAD